METQGNINRKETQGDRNFASMAAAYSLGVFNDNFFKQAAMLLAISAGIAGLQGTATVVFALPFILFSAYAGWLADRFPKKNVVVNGKVLELIAMLIGAIGVLTTNWGCILAMIFLMGLQSAVFGPALNGSIPEHFSRKEVTRINGILKMMTTTAILIGIACAGILLDVQSSAVGTANPGQVLIAVTVVLVSGAGLLASFGMKKYRAAAPAKPFPWAGPFQSLAHLWSTRKDTQLLFAVLSNAFFYFLATLVVLTINTYGLLQLGLSQSVTSLLSVALMIGVGAGSVCASRVATIDNWRKILIPGTFGMGCGIMAVAYTSCLPVEFRLLFLFVSLALTGFCGGVFLIPITSFIQVRPSKRDKGQIVAVAGFCSFTGILLAGQFYSFLDNFMQPGTMLFWTGIISFLAAASYGLFLDSGGRAFRGLICWIIRNLLKLRYTIEVKGLDRIEAGKDGSGVLFLSNHPALIDPVILVTALHKKFQPRPLADHDHTDKNYIRPLLDLVDAIRIPNLARNCRSTSSRITAVIDTVAGSLRQGDNILLYPAGRLYRSRYEKLGAKSAVHTIFQQNPEQRIVLVRIEGLWGSSFSWVDGRPLPLKEWKKYLCYAVANGLFFGPRRKVTVKIEEPVNFPRKESRLEINRTLEKYYNAVSHSNTHVPYYWWQGSTPVERPEPEGSAMDRSTSHVPESVRETILIHLREVTGVQEIEEKDKLAHDIGLDSLTIMELSVWLEREFGMPVEDLESIQTVADMMLAACGQTSGAQAWKTKRVPGSWFAGNSKKMLELHETSTVAHAFLDKAMSSPGKAVVADQISGVRTYRQLVMANIILKNQFRSVKSETLGIMLPAATSASICYFATLFAGKIPVMLNWTVGSGQMQHCINTAGVTHIVTARALMDKLREQGIDLSSLDVEWIYLENIREEISLFEKLKALVKSYISWASLRKSRISETAAILFTSGSEAQPKAVPLSHANILSNLKDFNSVLSFRESDRLLGMLPPFHSLGLAGTIIMPLCLGLKTTYHANPTEGGILAGLIEQYKSTILIGTPTFVNGILRSSSPHQLDSLRLLFTGAEKCPGYVYDEVGKVLPQAVLCEGYGITECSPVVSVNTPDKPQPGTIGRILPSMEYLIVDPEKAQPVGLGKQGLLLVRGENVFSGYLNWDKESPFVTYGGRNWYNTGDLVREDKSKTLTFCGRIKRFIKLGGEMISLPAIESVLQQTFPLNTDGAPALAVEATPNENHPEVVLFTTFKIEREDVNACIRKAGLSALHNIRRLVQVDSIPVLGTGKIDYRQLKTALV